MKYIALLRGINVGGNNKVAMSDLRICFEGLGLRDVSTFINSGNVLFSTDQRNESELVSLCEKAIEEQFGFAVVVMVISAEDLTQAVDDAPSWWASGDPKKLRSDALFVIPPTKPSEVLAEIQKKSSAVDKLEIRGQVIFWTLVMEDYNKSVVPKIIGTSIYRRVTMRSSTTTKKLYTLAQASK
ncbi:DUF1697 domain-containing protein [Candidatus Saccharibacteria bacterium]|nr:DUF1697 domain-containing protein [Candidatus Saccharibacteria bacterium]